MKGMGDMYVCVRCVYVMYGYIHRSVYRECTRIQQVWMYMYTLSTAVYIWIDLHMISVPTDCTYTHYIPTHNLACTYGRTNTHLYLHILT